MDAAKLIRTSRRRALLTLRELAERAGTSHATLVAYEAGRVTPRVDTLQRIVEAAGFVVDTELVPRMRRASFGGGTKGEELARVLHLAGSFPARHRPDLAYPPFRHR